MKIGKCTYCGKEVHINPCDKDDLICCKDCEKKTNTLDYPLNQ